MDPRIDQIVEEAKRQEESCLYTSTALFSWQKEVRVFRVAFIVIPIICGSFASARIFVRDPCYDWPIAIAAMVAGLFPAVFKALDLDVSLKTIADSANRFKTLQDRFRQASLIGATRNAAELEEEFLALMQRMDDTRSSSPTIPDRHFVKAQAKIKKGDYRFDRTKIS
ncbi:hypothetical protein [Achromobacter aloeverae]|uniref:Uncharacterized protein n=1 Tax=Achromobacter aloeverae TaxID=1750518 RepID=A0A4Q1HJC7_9BURK|nr:hypothetical protein [Achromobacter aloeverae]RXN87803.1 hypothetical protein C7R54_14500 [Achromobacter aloeverae]